MVRLGLHIHCYCSMVSLGLHSNCYCSMMRLGLHIHCYCSMVSLGLHSNCYCSMMRLGLHSNCYCSMVRLGPHSYCYSNIIWHSCAIINFSRKHQVEVLKVYIYDYDKLYIQYCRSSRKNMESIIINSVPVCFMIILGSLWNIFKIIVVSTV